MKNKESKREAEVIDITEHIKKRKLKNAENQGEIFDIESDLSELIELMELGTDDIAGTLVARHVHRVDLLPGIKTDDLMKELKIRIIHHQTLLDDLKEHISD